MEDSRELKLGRRALMWGGAATAITTQTGCIAALVAGFGGKAAKKMAETRKMSPYLYGMQASAITAHRSYKAKKLFKEVTKGKSTVAFDRQLGVDDPPGGKPRLERGRDGAFGKFNSAGVVVQAARSDAGWYFQTKGGSWPETPVGADRFILGPSTRGRGGTHMALIMEKEMVVKAMVMAVDEDKETTRNADGSRSTRTIDRRYRVNEFDLDIKTVIEDDPAMYRLFYVFDWMHDLWVVPFKDGGFDDTRSGLRFRMTETGIGVEHIDLR